MGDECKVAYMGDECKVAYMGDECKVAVVLVTSPWLLGMFILAYNCNL